MFKHVSTLACFLLLAVSAVAVPPSDQQSGSLRARVQNVAEKVNATPIMFTDEQKANLFDQVFMMKDILVKSGQEIAAAETKFMELVKKDFGDVKELSDFVKGGATTTLTDEQKAELFAGFKEVQVALFDGLDALMMVIDDIVDDIVDDMDMNDQQPDEEMRMTNEDDKEEDDKEEDDKEEDDKNEDDKEEDDKEEDDKEEDDKNEGRSMQAFPPKGGIPPVLPLDCILNDPRPACYLYGTTPAVINRYYSYPRYYPRRYYPRRYFNDRRYYHNRRYRGRDYRDWHGGGKGDDRDGRGGGRDDRDGRGGGRDDRDGRGGGRDDRDGRGGGRDGRGGGGRQRGGMDMGGGKGN